MLTVEPSDYAPKNVPDTEPSKPCVGVLPPRSPGNAWVYVNAAEIQTWRQLPTLRNLRGGDVCASPFNDTRFPTRATHLSATRRSPWLFNCPH